MRNPIYNGINDSIKDEAYRDAVKAEREHLDKMSREQTERIKNFVKSQGNKKDLENAKFTTREMNDDSEEKEVSRRKLIPAPVVK